MLLALICVSVLSFAAAIYIGWRYRAISIRFAPVLSADEEAQRVRKETERQRADSLKQIENAKSAAANAVSQAKSKVADLSHAYNGAKAIYDRLQSEISVLQATSDDMLFGLYKPQYSFDESQGYKQELDKIYDKKKYVSRMIAPRTIQPIGLLTTTLQKVNA